jgi:hypothetical protein
MTALKIIFITVVQTATVEDHPAGHRLKRAHITAARVKGSDLDRSHFCARL